MSDNFLVISCDGGGIRGVIPSLLLQDLSQSLIDSVDFFAGTSTGSVIALGLAGGVTIDQMVEYYEDPAICAGFFARYEIPHDHKVDSGLPGLIEKIGQKIEEGLDKVARNKIVDSLLFPQYSNEGRLEVLETMLPEATVEEVRVKNGKLVLATTFALDMTVDGRQTWRPTVISNLPEHNGLQGVSLVDAAMCSTSAPLGYEGWKLDNGVCYADGAVYANNPCAIALATLANSSVLGEEGLSRVYCLSLGTGFNFGSYPIQKGLSAKYAWGVLGWLTPFATDEVEKFPLMAAYSAGSLQSSDLVSRELLGHSRFRRANVDLKESISFSACDKLETMTKVTREYMQGSEWREIKNWIEESFTG